MDIPKEFQGSNLQRTDHRHTLDDLPENYLGSTENEFIYQMIQVDNPQIDPEIRLFIQDSFHSNDRLQTRPGKLQPRTPGPFGSLTLLQRTSGKFIRDQVINLYPEMILFSSFKTPCPNLITQTEDIDYQLPDRGIPELYFSSWKFLVPQSAAFIIRSLWQGFITWPCEENLLKILGPRVDTRKKLAPYRLQNEPTGDENDLGFRSGSNDCLMST